MGDHAEHVVHVGVAIRPPRGPCEASARPSRTHAWRSARDRGRGFFTRSFQASSSPFRGEDPVLVRNHYPRRGSPQHYSCFRRAGREHRAHSGCGRGQAEREVRLHRPPSEAIRTARFTTSPMFSCGCSSEAVRGVLHAWSGTSRMKTDVVAKSRLSEPHREITHLEIRRPGEVSGEQRGAVDASDQSGSWNVSTASSDQGRSADPGRQSSSLAGTDGRPRVGFGFHRRQGSWRPGSRNVSEPVSLLALSLTEPRRLPRTRTLDARRAVLKL